MKKKCSTFLYNIWMCKKDVLISIKWYLNNIFLVWNDIFWFKWYLNEIKLLWFVWSCSTLVISPIFTLNGENQTRTEQYLNGTEKIKPELNSTWTEWNIPKFQSHPWLVLIYLKITNLGGFRGSASTDSFCLPWCQCYKTFFSLSPTFHLNQAKMFFSVNYF